MGAPWVLLDTEAAFLNFSQMYSLCVVARFAADHLVAAIVGDLHRDASTELLVGGEILSRLSDSRVGLRQGCPTSGSLLARHRSMGSVGHGGIVARREGGVSVRGAGVYLDEVAVGTADFWRWLREARPVLDSPSRWRRRCGSKPRQDDAPPLARTGVDVFGTQRRLLDACPAWGAVAVVTSARYLGVFLAPRVTASERWAEPLRKVEARASTLGGLWRLDRFMPPFQLGDRASLVSRRPASFLVGWGGSLVAGPFCTCASIADAQDPALSFRRVARSRLSARALQVLCRTNLVAMPRASTHLGLGSTSRG